MLGKGALPGAVPVGSEPGAKTDSFNTKSQLLVFDPLDGRRLIPHLGPGWVKAWATQGSAALSLVQLMEDSGKLLQAARTSPKSEARCRRRPLDYRRRQSPSPHSAGAPRTLSRTLRETEGRGRYAFYWCLAFQLPLLGKKGEGMGLKRGNRTVDSAQRPI